MFKKRKYLYPIKRSGNTVRAFKSSRTNSVHDRLNIFSKFIHFFTKVHSNIISMLKIFLKNKSLKISLPKISLIKIFVVLVLIFHFLKFLELKINVLEIGEPGLDKLTNINILMSLTRDDLRLNPNAEIVNSFILSINKQSGRVRTLGINPNFVILKKGAVFFTMSNFFQTEHSFLEKSDLSNYFSRVSEFTGLKINKFVFLDYQNLIEVFARNNISFTANDDFEFNGSSFKKGHSLGARQIMDVYIDGLFVNSDQNYLRIRDMFNDFISYFHHPNFLYKIFLDNVFILDKIHTNISRDNLIELVLILNNFQLPIRTGYISSLFKNFSPREVVNVLEPNFEAIYEEVVNTFSDIDIIREQSRIEVYNATGHTGLAGRVRRMILNQGGRVITFNNFVEEVDQTTLYVIGGEIARFKANVNMITDLFNGKIIIGTGNFEYNSTGDLVLIIGKDYIL